MCTGPSCVTKEFVADYIDLGADDVAGQQVRRALDALEPTVHRVGDCPSCGGLGQAGNASRRTCPSADRPISNDSRRSSCPTTLAENASATAPAMRWASSMSWRTRMLICGHGCAATPPNIPATGFGRAWAALRHDEHREVNKKKVHRLWRQEGLQVPVHSPRKTCWCVVGATRARGHAEGGVGAGLSSSTPPSTARR